MNFHHPFIGLDLTTLLETRARQRGSHPLLLWAPFDAPVETWSYARFANEVSCISGGLAARGIKRGDRVLVHLENCPEAVLLHFACARLGAICVVTNAAAAGPEVGWFAGLTGARRAITQPKFASLLTANCPTLDWLAITETDAGTVPSQSERPPRSFAFAALHGDPLPLRPAEPALPASLMFTSGTTARPKGVVWTHANALWGGKLGAMQLGMRPDDVCHLFLPLCHVIGFGWSLMPTLWAGATLLLQPRFSASRYWKSALEHRATIGSQVIPTTRWLSQQPVPKHSFRQWTSGLWMPELEKHFGLRIAGGWGMTEVISQCILGDSSLPQFTGSIGRPSAAYQLRIVDDNGRQVAPGGTGQLLVGGKRGLSLFAEYFGDPRATAEAFDAEGYFRTGDLVTLHEDGSISFSERLKDVLKVSGENVSAAEVETIVMAVRGVQEAAVVGRPDSDYGEVPVAFVLLDADLAPEEAKERILDHCRLSLAKFKVPRQVVVMHEDFPRIGNGKIFKKRLREIARERQLQV